MRTDEEWIDLYESLHENDMLWFSLASMISSENFYMLDDVEKKRVYEQNIRFLKQMVELFPKTNIEVKTRKKLVKYAKRGAKLLQKEYDQLLKNKQE